MRTCSSLPALPIQELKAFTPSWASKHVHVCETEGGSVALPAGFPSGLSSSGCVTGSLAAGTPLTVTRKKQSVHHTVIIPTSIPWHGDNLQPPPASGILWLHTSLRWAQHCNPGTGLLDQDSKDLDRSRRKELAWHR